MVARVLQVLALLAALACAACGDHDAGSNDVVSGDSGDASDSAADAPGEPTDPADPTDAAADSAEDTTDETPGEVVPPTFGPLAVVVDPAIVPSIPDPAPVGPDGNPLPVAALVGPDGSQVEFVEDQLAITGRDLAAVQAFATRWHGTILSTSDGTLHGLPSTWVVSVDPAGADVATLAARLAQARPDLDPPTAGEHRVSSPAALALLAVYAEASYVDHLTVAPLWLMRPAGVAEGSVHESTPENHSDDACTWSYMVRAVNAPATGTCAAWQLMASQGLFDATAVRARFAIGILDDDGELWNYAGELPAGSAWWDANSDFHDAGHAPRDAVYAFHTTKMALAAAALVDNGLGTAGAAGPLAPVVYGIGVTPYDPILRMPAPQPMPTALTRGLDIAYAVRELHRGPPIRVMVFGLDSPTVPNAFASPAWIEALDTAVGKYQEQGILLVAPAGNGHRTCRTLDDCQFDTFDVDRKSLRADGSWQEIAQTFPCELDDVLWVGGANTHDPTRLGTIEGNRGSDWSGNSVDLLGPWGILGAGFGDDSVPSGTSYAAAFVGGIAALVYASDPTLSPDALIRRLLAARGAGPYMVDARFAIAATFPEVCNGADDDGNQVIDDHIAPVACYTADIGTVGVGVCRAGQRRCPDITPGWRFDDSLQNIKPEAWCASACARLVTCQLADTTDAESCFAGCMLAPTGDVQCVLDSTFKCLENHAAGCNIVLEKTPLLGPCEGAIVPSEEVCNGADDDCDGQTDDDVIHVLLRMPCYSGPDGTADVGACRTGHRLCEGGSFAPTCNYEVVPTVEDVGNALDDDCDGRTDEPLPVATVTATRNRPDAIEVAWSPVAGATSYRVFRTAGAVEVSADLASPPFIDTGADGPLGPTETALTASDGDGPEIYVLLDAQGWDADGTHYSYRVLALHGEVPADRASPSAVGYRFGRPEFVGFQLALEPLDHAPTACASFLDCAMDETCVNQRCYDLLDTRTMSAPELYPDLYTGELIFLDRTPRAGGSVDTMDPATASDGVPASHVALDVPGWTAHAPVVRHYHGRWLTTAGTGPWASDDGFRVVTPTVRWERTLGPDLAPPWIAVAGAAGRAARDLVGSYDGSIHWYRAVASALGTADVTSAPDAGRADPKGFHGVTVGLHHACAAKAGRAVCWGDASSGATAAPDGPWQLLAAGDDFTCGIDAAAALRCWGQGFGSDTRLTLAGELAIGVVISEVPKDAALATDPPIRLCILRSDTTARCVDGDGKNLALQPTGNWSTLVNVGCGVRLDGAPACWDPRYDVTASASPYRGFMPVLLDNGVVGNDDHGLVGWLADGTAVDQATCDNVGSLCTTFASCKPPALAARSWSAMTWSEANLATCAIADDDHQITCAGTCPSPIATVPGCPSEGFVDVDLGPQPPGATVTACASRTDGRLECWGGETAIVDGNPSRVPLPRPALHGASIASMGYGGYAVAAIDAVGAIQAWGALYGLPLSPANVPSDRLVVDTAEPDHVYRVTIDGIVVAIDSAGLSCGTYPPTTDLKCGVVYALADAIMRDPRLAARVVARPEFLDGPPALLIEARQNGDAYTLAIDDPFLDRMPLAPADGFVQVATTLGGGAAITADHRLVTFGTMAALSGSIVRPPEGAFDAVACDWLECCAREMTTGTLACFGAYPAQACGDGRCDSPETVETCASDCADEAGAGEPGDRPRLAMDILPAELRGVVFTAFAVGTSLRCGIDQGQALRCWDLGSSGGVGEVDVATHWMTKPILEQHPDNTFTAIALSDDTACALDVDGRAICAWEGYRADEGGRAQPPADARFSVLSIGGSSNHQGHVCGLLRPAGPGGAVPGTPGPILCWGGPTAADPPPPSGDFVALASGYQGGCAERADGELVCWGYEVPRGGVLDIDLAVGGGHSEYGPESPCWLSVDGSLGCAYSYDPVPSACSPWTSLSMAGAAVVVDAKGEATCFCPNGSHYCQGFLCPAVEALPGPWSRLAIGASGAVCGIQLDDGAVECMDVTDPTFATSVPPELATPEPEALPVEVAVGVQTFCVLRADGTLVCGGSEVSGAITAIPDLVADERWSKVRVSARSACGLTTRGRIACWGAPGETPLAPTEEGFRDLDFDMGWLCAVTAAGTTGCYAMSLSAPNDLRQTPTLELAHAPLPGGDYRQVAAASAGVCGRRGDGTVTCRGIIPR